MEALLLYWLKANVVLALFAAAYYGLLRRLTFFQLNRAYLWFAVLFAAAYPLLPMPALLPAEAAAGLPATPVLALPGLAYGTAVAGPVPAGSSGWVLPTLGALYLAGAAGLLLRLLGQLLSLGQLRRRARPAVVLGQAVRLVPGAGGPFSFGRTIYLTDSALVDTESLPVTLRHELAHVRQHHTLDVLLWQLATALAWANPAAWLLRRAALDTLEYLADAAALHDGHLSRRAYQYLLLHQQVGRVPVPALAFHFSFLTLKNRIAMLNQPHSTARQLGRYVLAAPLVAALALAYTGARAQSASPAVPAPAKPIRFMPPAAAKAATASQTLATVAPGQATAQAPATPIRFMSPAAVEAAAASRTPAPGQASHLAYYVDAQPSTAAAVNALGQASVASMDVVKYKATIERYARNSDATGVAFVTTKANANSPAVLALAEQNNLPAAYEYKPIAVNALVPKVLAYITSHYPNARLSGDVQEVKRKSSGAVRYDVQLIEGRRPYTVSFSPEGSFLGEQR